MTEVKMVRCPDCGGPIDACECEPRLTGREVFQKWQPSDASLFAQNPDHPSMFRHDEPLIPIAQGWSDPPAELLTDPAFEAIWDVIKTWDINVPSAYGGYCGATGNHVYAIYRALAEKACGGLNADQITWFNNVVQMLPEKEREITTLRTQNQQWQDTWAATEHHRQEAVALIEERDREIVQLRAERAAWKHLFEVAAGEQSDARMIAADEAHPYHGPTRPVTDADGNVTGRESVPDPVHERVHEVIGDVLAGKVMRPAREQMEKALTDARAKDGKAPPFPVAPKSTDHRRIGL